MKTCDIFTLLTRYPNEGKAISILEAMGNGMMIVTTDHAGIPDIVKDRVNGIVLKEENSVATLYYNLTELSVNNFTKIAMTNRDIVKMKYTQKEYVTNMKKAMSKILK